MNSGAAIVSDKQLGDVLLLQPSAAYLGGVFEKPTALFVNEAFQPLVELMPGCVWGPSMKGHFHELWTTSWSSRAVWQAFKVRAKKRRLIVNKPRHVRWWYRLIFNEIKLNPAQAEYWSRYFWQVISGLNKEMFLPPQLTRPPAEWRHVSVPDGEFILINPTAAWERKFWSAAQWAEIINQLSPYKGLPLVIAGGGSDREKVHCQRIVDSCKVPVINLAGQTSLKQYLDLVSAARLVLCIDGAASHLAQAFGVPTVTIFGPSHDGKWHWPSTSTKVLAARHFNDSGAPGPASAVPVEAVWQAILQMESV